MVAAATHEKQVRFLPLAPPKLKGKNMRPVYAALCDACEEAASKGRRQSAETVLGYSTNGGFDTCLGQMLRALAAYADTHLAAYESVIASDYIIGAEWRRSLASTRALLNGETGRLDCGDVDRAILAMFQAAGFEDEEP